MASLKKSELDKMAEAELKSRLGELKMELIKYNAQISRGTPPENPGKLRSVKRNIARILTTLNMKKIGGVSQ